MIHNTIVCAPDGPRDQLRQPHPDATRPGRWARGGPIHDRYRDLEVRLRIGLKSWPGTSNCMTRSRTWSDDRSHCRRVAPNLIARNSIGHAELPTHPNGRPATLRDCGRKSASASLCGVSPVRRRREKTVRHRLNRGGDRAATARAVIAIGRSRTDQRTKDYVARRIAEGIQTRRRFPRP